MATHGSSLLGFLVLTSALMGLSACGDPAPSPRGPGWGPPENGLMLRLAFDETRYREGDPVTITVEANNVSSEQLTLFHFEDETWWYHVTFENLGEGPDFLGGAGLFIDFSEPPNATLAPGGVWAKTAELSDERRRFLRIIENRKPGDDWDYRTSLPPGRYRAWLEYAPGGSGDADLWKGRVRSNTVEVEVLRRRRQ